MPNRFKPIQTKPFVCATSNNFQALRTTVIHFGPLRDWSCFKPLCTALQCSDPLQMTPNHSRQITSNYLKPLCLTLHHSRACPNTGFDPLHTTQATLQQFEPLHTCPKPCSEPSWNYLKSVQASRTTFPPSMHHAFWVLAMICKNQLLAIEVPM